MGVLGMESPILENFAPPEAQIRRIGARFENMLFSKKGTVSKGRVSGHPGHPRGSAPAVQVLCGASIDSATYDQLENL